MSFAYEGRGGPVKVGGDLVSLERDLDAFGRVHGETMGSHSLRVAWSAGTAIALQSDVGLPVRYEFDVTGHLDRVRIGDRERQVDRQSGSDVLTSLGQHLILRRRFGLNGRLAYQGLGKRVPGLSDAQLALPGGPGTALFVEYEYDVAGKLTRERRSDGRTIQHAFTVDGQVASRVVHRAGRVEREEHVGYGATGTPRMAGARYDAVERPVSLHGECFEYDELSRLVRRTTDAGTWRYEWNGLDQLTRVHAPTHTVEMDYDARSRRVQKRVLRDRRLVSKTSYVWNNNLVIHEVDELTGATRTYDRVDGSWETFGHVDVRDGVTRATYYMLAPGGAVDLAVDEVGKIVWDGDTTIYGDREVRSADVDVTARFPNQFFDADVGLSYTWHRWYEARLGVFVTPDPLFLDGNLSPRAFAENPLLQCDPTGWYPSVPPFSPAGSAAQPGANAQPAYPNMPGVPGSVVCPPEMHKRDVRAPASTQREIDDAGSQHGCHSCGASSPGTKPRKTGGKAHWVADHQPPLSTYGTPVPANANIRLYPHCLNCARSQGGLMSHHATAVGAAVGEARNVALTTPPPP